MGAVSALGVKEEILNKIYIFRAFTYDVCVFDIFLKIISYLVDKQIFIGSIKPFEQFFDLFAVNFGGIFFLNKFAILFPKFLIKFTFISFAFLNFKNIFKIQIGIVFIFCFLVRGKSVVINCRICFIVNRRAYRISIIFNTAEITEFKPCLFKTLVIVVGFKQTSVYSSHSVAVC